MCQNQLRAPLRIEVSVLPSHFKFKFLWRGDTIIDSQQLIWWLLLVLQDRFEIIGVCPPHERLIQHLQARHIHPLIFLKVVIDVTLHEFPLVEF